MRVDLEEVVAVSRSSTDVKHLRTGDVSLGRLGTCDEVINCNVVSSGISNASRFRRINFASNNSRNSIPARLVTTGALSEVTS